MSKQTIQSIAIQKLLQLPEEDALKVFMFMVGLEAGIMINPATYSHEQQKENREPTT